MRRVLNVQGRPTPYSGGNNELNWCNAIAQAVENSGGREDVDKETVFSVNCFFRLSEIGGSDIDNLTKPVLDTLFQSRGENATRPTGLLFNVDDKRVVELYLHKEVVENKEKLGATIEIWW